MEVVKTTSTSRRQCYATTSRQMPPRGSIDAPARQWRPWDLWRPSLLCNTGQKRQNLRLQAPAEWHKMEGVSDFMPLQRLPPALRPRNAGSRGRTRPNLDHLSPKSRVRPGQVAPSTVRAPEQTASQRAAASSPTAEAVLRSHPEAQERAERAQARGGNGTSTCAHRMDGCLLAYSRNAGCGVAAACSCR